MIRIGDFARLSRVSVKTLRLYDELGLLKPAHVDRDTGYRYYAHEQYPQLSRIRALRDLGFSLDEIQVLVAAGLSGEQMQAMLTLKSSEVRRQIEADQARLARVEAWLGQMKGETSMSQYEVIIKRVPALQTANVRGVVEQPAEQAPLWQELFEHLRQYHVEPTGPCISLYHDEEQPDGDWDIEVSAPISATLPETDRVTVRELPAVESMACLVYSGPFLAIHQAYSALWMWVAEHGYRLVGPAREVVIRAPRVAANGADQTDPSTVVEIQFPIEPAAGATA